jgi:hypothetical protein
VRPQSGGSVTVHLLRSGALGTAVSVQFATFNGSAVSSADHICNIGGVAFNINTNLVGNSVNAALGANGAFVNLVASYLTGSGLSTAIHTFTIDPTPFATGTYTMHAGGSHGFMTYGEAPFSGAGRVWEVAGGSSAAGSYGTVTIDAIDTNTKMFSGRMTFHTRETTGNVAGGFKDIVLKFRSGYL